jgi:hypothetical protein
MMIKKSLRGVIFIAGMAAFILSSTPVRAQVPAYNPGELPLQDFVAQPEKPAEVKEEKESLYQPVPPYEIPPEEFQAKTRVFEDTPNSYETMAYSLRIPKEWEQVKAKEKEEGDKDVVGESSRNILSEVVRFYGPSLLDARTYFTMTLYDLPQEITAENWLLNYAQQNSHPLQFMTVISEKKAEALYVTVEGDTSYVVRALAEMNGNMMAYLAYAIPEQKWKDERPFQDHVLRSFAFKEHLERQVEERRTYAFLDLLRFDYPSSWRLMAPSIYSIEAMDAKIINSIDEKIVKGEIDVHVVSTELDTTLAEEVKVLQKAFEGRGLVIGKLIDQPADFKSNDHIYFSRIEVYQANNKEKTLIDHEYWIGILMEDRYFYIVTMLTPARTIDFYTWATNTEAFETVIETLRP